MPKRVLRYGVTSTVMATLTGKARELIVNITDNRIHVHDGITPGGQATAKQSEVALKIIPSAANNVALLSTSGQLVDSGLSVTDVGLPEGTKALFAQATAPIGWAIDMTHNNKSLRIVSNGHTSGGTDAFSDVFGTGKATAGHTITIAEMPTHTITGSLGGESVGHTHAGTTDNVTVGHTHPFSATTGGQSATHTHSEKAANTQANPLGFASGANTHFAQIGTTVETGVASVDHNHPVSGVTDVSSSTNHGHPFTTAGNSVGHIHAFTADAIGGNSAHAHTIATLNLQFVDSLICTKLAAP